MKKHLSIVLLVILIVTYSMVLISAETGWFTVTSTDDHVYWTDSDGEVYECGQFYNPLVRVLTNDINTYQTTTHKFYEMNEYCESNGYQCVIYSTNYDRGFARQYIDCIKDTGLEITPTPQGGDYQCGATENSGVETVLTANIWPYDDALEYCESLNYDCDQYWDGLKYNFFCSGREPNTICYTCTDGMKKSTLFVDSCPNDWTNDSSIDCRPIVNCFQCQNQELVIRNFYETCNNGWNNINDTVMQTADYCVEQNKAIKFIKDNLITNVIFVIIFLTLIIAWIKGE